MGCCNTLSGIALNCESNRGGVKSVWVCCADSVSASVSDGKVRLTSPTVGGSDWLELAFRKGVTTMTSTLTADDANGVYFVSTELALTFARMDTAKRTAIEGLIGSDVCVLVLDNNGTYWLLGWDEVSGARGCTLSAGTGQTGAASTDGNYYTLTFTDESSGFPYEVQV